MRVILTGNIQRGDKVHVKFNAKVADKDKDKAGNIAYNSFAYAYHIPGTETTSESWSSACPTVVGVGIPH